MHLKIVVETSDMHSVCLNILYPSSTHVGRRNFVISFFDAQKKEKKNLNYINIV